MYQKVLVVAAHPDDEMLGAGGTIARLAKNAQVVVLFLASGCESVAPGNWREREALQALRVCGVEYAAFCRYPDQRLDTVSQLELTQHIEPTIESAKIELVITHHAGDVNLDHVATHRAVMAAVRPKPGCSVKEVWAMEIPGSTEWGAGFAPNVFVDITDLVFQKMDALAKYGTAMKEYPHPRSFEHVQRAAFYRGAQAGVEAAEAFMLVRRLI